LNWLGSSSALSNNLILHAQQFIGPFSLKKELRDCFRVIWLACTWMIWSDHNNIIWLQGMSSSQTIDCMKIHVWLRIKAKQKTFFMKLIFGGLTTWLFLASFFLLCSLVKLYLYLNSCVFPLSKNKSIHYKIL